MGGFQLQSDDALSSARITYENGGSNSSVIIPKDGGKISVGTHLNGLTPCHLLEGSVQVLNTTSTPAVSNVLYTGTGSALDVTTGMDMDTQWGNLASERFGGMTLIKGNNASVTSIVDSIRGVSSTLLWNSPSISASQVINSFSTTGFQVTSANSNVNTSGIVYQSLSFGTNRRRSGVTNHGMSFTEHYNIESGFTILNWYGSGKDRHEIPHMLGRKFDFYMIKNLTNGSVNYQANYEGQSKNFFLANNSINNEQNTENIDVWTTDSLLNVSNTDRINFSSQQYVCYAWCSAKLDNDKKLLGNYEVIKYNGNDYQIGSLLKTKAKPLAMICKAVTANSEWILVSSKNGVDKYQTLSNSGLTLQSAAGTPSFTNEGIIFPFADWCNAKGTDYIMIVMYDNDNGSGKSMYNRSNDSSTLNLVNARVPFASGLDTMGSTKISTLNRNEVISGVSLIPGKNYLAMTNSGSYVNSTYNPNYNVYSGFGDYYDSNRNKWYKNVSILSDNFTSDTLANYTAENASLSIINGKLKIQNTGTSVRGKANRVVTTVVGKRYAVVYDYNATDYWAGVLIGTSLGGTDLLAIGDGVKLRDNGIKYFTATTTTTYVSLVTTATTGMIGVFDHIAIYPVNNDNTVDLSNATEILDSRNYLSTIVYADHNSQPVMVESLIRSIYNKDISITGILDFNKVEKVNSDNDYNFNINGKKKLQITENNGILNQDGKPLSSGGLKNIIINGSFDVWQRGTSIGYNPGGALYKWVADRWYVGYDAAGANTTVYPTMEDNYEGRRTQAIAITTNAIGSNTYVDLTTCLEDMLKYAGRTFTISFLCVSDSTAPLRLYIGRYYSASAGLVYSDGYLFGNGQPNGMKKYSVTFRVPDYNGEVYDKNTSYLKILIRHDRNTNGTFRIAEVQMEEGTVATSFEHRPYGMELNMCQRYYEKGELKIFIGTTNTAPSGTATFKATKRKVPSISTDASYQGIKRYSSTEWINTEAFSAMGIVTGTTGELNISYTADAELITL